MQIEIVVVDNASRDGTIEMLRTEFPMVKVVENSVNRFYAPAMNQALRVSLGRYVLVLNDDATLLPGALQTLVYFMNEHPTTGIVGPRTYDRNGRLLTTIHSSYWFSSWLASGLGLYRYVPWVRKSIGPLIRKINPRFGQLDPHDSECEVDCIDGGCLFVRKDAIEDVGLLDEHLLVGLEDQDWCLRMRTAGLKVMFTPSAGIVHEYGPHKGTSRKQLGSLAEQLFYQGAIYMLYKYRGRAVAGMLKWLLVIGSFLRMTLLMVESLLVPWRHVEARASAAELGSMIRALVLPPPSIPPLEGATNR
jgi:N-acetylglucosaminyl-diphospho-decaprenol L-rhamnosyltransferase